MGIKLDISVETPLSDDDRDILAGISVMVLAIANRQPLFPDSDEEGEKEPKPCGAFQYGDGSIELYCVSEVGHTGRHKYRPITTHSEEPVN